MTHDRADTFLRLIQRSQRGRLKIYFGYAAGVGKTYQMLLEGHRLKGEGIDVVIGLVETHGRADTEGLIEGLEVVPRYRQDYRGIAVEEMDLDAVLERKPQVALIDELAHTNVPGSRNPKRYQDVQDIIAAGIHVITTLNVQHLETLYNEVEKVAGIKVRERLPDTIVAEADQIVNVDLTAEDLRKRLQEGKVYPQERIDTAMNNFFITSNLEQLREMTLRELASQIELRMRDTTEESSVAAGDQVMVCLSSRGPNSEMLLRYASRLAGRFNKNWYAVYVQTPFEEVVAADPETQHMVSNTLTMAKQLGATVFIYKGEDVVGTILQFAKEYRVGHIVVGRPRKRSFWQKHFRKHRIVDTLIEDAREIVISIVDTYSGKYRVHAGSQYVRDGVAGTSTIPAPVIGLKFGELLKKSSITIWQRPVNKNESIKALTHLITEENRGLDAQNIFEKVLQREEQGSTFFNEGAAFPHARLNNIGKSYVALGVTLEGVSDITTDVPIRYVMLIISPADNPAEQIKLLGNASRMFRDRIFTRIADLAEDSEEILAAIRNWEKDP